MRTAALLALLSATAAAPAPAPPDLFSIERVAPSPDGGAVALATADPDAKTLLSVTTLGPVPQRVYSFGREALDAILPEASVTDLAWSPDGRILAIEIAGPELATAIALLDLRGRDELVPLSIDGHDNLALPRWGPKGHELWAVHGEIAEHEEEEDVRGVFRLDLDSRASTRFLTDRWITEFQISGSTLLALTADDAPDGTVVARLIRLDLRSGRSETLFQQKSDPAGTRGRGISV